MQSVQDLCTLFSLKLNSSIDCRVDEKLFENSVKIYINKPQVVNKWSAGSCIIEEEEDGCYDLIKNKNDLNLINSCLTNPLFEIENRQFLAKNLKIFQNIHYFILYDRQLQFFILKPYFLTSDDETRKYCACWYSHAFEYDKVGKCINLYVEHIDESKDENVSWLSGILLKKISNWCGNLKLDENLEDCIKLSTLTLYKNMLMDYYKLYQELKVRYLNELSSINWLELTNTNPEKFVHEDISIATHLILTWRHFNCDKNKIRFADLGCGNGLLVYILNQEGYNGYGVDLRKRRIWDFYCNTDAKYKSKLIECQIDPRIDKYNDSNWLIGNHSDELSPWLPLIANRAAEGCNLYLIPCCFFDFNGKFSFNEIKKNESRYDNYLSYLSRVFKMSGYELYKDKLRIPSTKNIVLIGIHNPEAEIDHEKLNALMNSNSEAFKIRDYEEEKLKSSRNCTRNIDNDLKEFIVKTILECLLKPPLGEYIKKHDSTDWNAGRRVNLTEIVNLFDKDVLVKLKQECGGMKTLIKNNHQLFEVVDRDFIKIRISQVDNKDNKEKAKFLKTRPCSFDLYHPNGCLLHSDVCNFIHK